MSQVIKRKLGENSEEQEKRIIPWSREDSSHQRIVTQVKGEKPEPKTETKNELTLEDRNHEDGECKEEEEEEEQEEEEEEDADEEFEEDGLEDAMIDPFEDDDLQGLVVQLNRNRTIVGGIWFTPSKSEPSVSIHKIFVEPAFRMRGFAKQLVDALFEAFQDHTTIRWIRLTLCSTDIALPFWNRMAFVESVPFACHQCGRLFSRAIRADEVERDPMLIRLEQAQHMRKELAKKAGWKSWTCSHCQFSNSAIARNCGGCFEYHRY